MRGSNWLVWSISACARSGTAASSGVIFSPDSVRMASGSSLSLAGRVTVPTARPAAANALPVLVAVRVDRRGQGLLALECGELLDRQQVVVEVAELPRALDPDVAGAQGVLQLGQGADFVEFPVEAFRGDHQRLPARLDEGRGCIGRHLAQVVGVHLTQGLHACQHALRVPARRAVPAPPARPACNGAGWRSSRRPGAGGRSLPAGPAARPR